MEQGILNLYKRPGETPLECLERARLSRQELSGVPMTYAGRLDPMAEGVLIALAGEARFRREEFLALDKEYEFDVLWGFETDTFDALGIARRTGEPVDLERLPDALKAFTGLFEQPYPPFSSKPVDGEPLFEIARRGEAVELPTKAVAVRFLELLRTRSVNGGELLAGIAAAIAAVRGDFRQETAAESWRKALSGAEGEEFAVSSLRAACSSGTYVRGIASGLGKELGSGAIALRIVRTRVGEHSIEDSAR